MYIWPTENYNSDYSSCFCKPCAFSLNLKLCRPDDVKISSIYIYLSPFVLIALDMKRKAVWYCFAYFTKFSAHVYAYLTVTY